MNANRGFYTGGKTFPDIRLPGEIQIKQVTTPLPVVHLQEQGTALTHFGPAIVAYISKVQDHTRYVYTAVQVI